MSHTPTREQQEAIDVFLARQNLVLKARAGTGKTSTAKAMAVEAAPRRGIYVCFNSSVAKEARDSFPRSVRCSTSHGLAFGSVGKRYETRLNSSRRLPSRETAQILGITRPVQVADVKLSPQQQAQIVMEMLERFCKAPERDFVPWHTPRVNGLDEPRIRKQLGRVLLPYARKAWADVTSLDGKLFYKPNYYLKEWQVSGPRLHGDFLIYDEAQDANLAMLDVVLGQAGHMQLVAIGDEAQAINRWNGAVNSMGRFPADIYLSLSQSFRFGPAIAAEANKWLRLLGSEPPVRGFDRIASVVADCPTADAVLCRTNAGAMSEAMDAMRNGQEVAIVGGAEQIRRLAEAAQQLKEGQPTDHPELLAFETWGQVQEFVEQDPDGSDLKVFVSLIDDYGPEAIIDAADHLADERSAQVVVSTAHKVKGREWPKVRISSDFPAPNNDPATPGTPRVDPDLAMLAYVAVTRARDVLDRGSLGWVDDYLPGAPQAATDRLVAA